MAADPGRVKSPRASTLHSSCTTHVTSLVLEEGETQKQKRLVLAFAAFLKHGMCAHKVWKTQANIPNNLSQMALNVLFTNVLSLTYT